MKIKTTTLTLDRFKRRLRALILPVALSISSGYAQTILVNPATDGGFELGTGSLSDNGWTSVSGTAASKDAWYTASGRTNGLFSFPSNTRCAYVSRADTSWEHSTTTGVGNIPHMYKTITVPAGQTDVVVSFQYQQAGTTNTKLMVYVTDAANTPNASNPSGNGGDIGTSWGPGASVLLFSAATPLTAGTKTFTAPIPPSFLNNCSGPKTFKLVFTSFRNSTSGNNPPPAVDSISVISRTPVPVGSGVFTINNTAATSGTNFKSFTEAINWVNAFSNCGLTKAITFNVSAGQVFNEDVPYVTASGTATMPVIFQKSGAGANPVIRPTGTFGAYQPTTSTPGSHDYGVCLHGADYITFDGIDIQSNASSGFAVEYGYIVRNALPTNTASGSSTNGANNNTIKNATIILDRTVTTSKGIIQTASAAGGLGGGVGALNSSGTNNNNKYLNLTIGNVNQGISLYGTSTNVPDMNNFIGSTAPGVFNQIGRPNVPNDIGNTSTASVGVNLQNQYDATVSNCNIMNVSSSGIAEGISFGTISNSSVFNGAGGFNNYIYNNQISFIKGQSTSSTTAIISGIRIQHDNLGSLGLTGFKIYNNSISNLSSAYSGTATVTRAMRGLYLQGAATSNPVTVQYDIINNTVIVDGSSSPNLSNIAFEGAYNGVILKFRNNLFANLTGPQALANHYVLGVVSATTTLGASGSLSDYNDFYLANTTGGLLSFNSSIPNLATWKSNFGVDANSISADPKLNSSVNLYPLYTSPLVGACPTLSAPYNKDIFGDMRNPLASTIGAFEQAGDIIPPVISDTIIVGVNSTSNRVLSDFLKIEDGGTTVDNTSGAAPRIYYKKSTEANVFGANNSSANGWKYVEASNSTSPFSFTLDYALLNTPLAIHDVIQYFYVAQDTVAIPNVAALPSAGFAGTSVSAITQAPTTPKSFVIYNTPAAFVDAVLSQATTAKVMTGTSNQQIVRVAVQTAATGDSAYVTSFTFHADGVNDYANITAAKVWYTGTSATFATTNQFGFTQNIATGTGPLGDIYFTGSQIVPPNATTYFWLSYDINTGGISTDPVDASIVSLTYNGVLKTPSVATAPGERLIKPAYCVPALTTAYCVSNVKFNTLNNTTTTCAVPAYSSFKAEGSATTTVLRGRKYDLSLTQAAGSTASRVFIDYNDDGVFDESEAITVSLIGGSAGLVTTVPVTIPCDAVISSQIGMRVRSYYAGTAPVACSTNPGEVEDYTISIADNPASYVSSSAVQTSGIVSVGATNKVMMQVKVVAQGCGTVSLTQLYCQTAKTNNALSNISNVKLYTTGTGNVFNTNNMLSALGAAPSNKFTLSGFTQSLSNISGDTNYFWITYDIHSAANRTDTIDIAVDSIVVDGQNFVPANNNPVEVLKVANQNAYVSSLVSNPMVNRTPRVGQAGTPVLRVRIITSDTAAPLQLTQLNLVTNGVGNDSANIAFAKVYYTGKTDVFSTATQFGNAYTEPNTTIEQWNAYTIQGNQFLNYDTNYFWVAYDLKNSAIVGDQIDADLTEFTINGVSRVATSNTSTGTFSIQYGYCESYPAGTVALGGNVPTAVEELSNVVFGTLSNASTCSQTGGPGSMLNMYSDYSETVAVPDVAVNSAVSFSLTGISNCASTTASGSTLFAIYIDLNQDGDFIDAGENVYRSTAVAGVLAGRTVSGTVTIPCTASLGKTRMRVIYAGGTNSATLTSCGNIGYQFGETEDYTINIVANPITYAATRTSQTSGLTFAGASNVNIMRVAVKMNGCGNTTLTGMHFKTTGTTTVAKITGAKLYATGTSNVFSTANQIGTATVGTELNFTSLSANITNAGATDSNYFWLTYDISGAAVSGDVFDTELDSIKIAGTNLNTVANGNPAGALTIASKITFVAAKAAHTDLSTVAIATQNRNILRVLVLGSAGGGAPVNITSLSFNATGINSLINLDSARVFYTGKSATFAATNQFGTGYSAAPGSWGAFTFNGNVSTSLDTNYFWLTYTIKSTANIGDYVDAEFTSVEFDGNTVAPLGTDGDPAGNIAIRGPYCTSVGSGSPFLGFLYNVTAFSLDSITTTSAAGAPYYTDYSAAAPRNIKKGAVNSFNITTQSGMLGITEGYVRIYVDFDQNGDFTGADELAYAATVPFGMVPGSISVPCNAKTGLTRMRIVVNFSDAITSCGTPPSYGETEDYTVNIGENPVVYTTSYASQTNGLVSQGRNGQAIMNIKVKVGGCGTPIMSNMYFNTVGSNNPLTNITEAKLYTTGTSTVFNTNKLLGTYFMPNGLFDFGASAISDTLKPDTINYWLAYDINGSATNGDTLDVRVDSIVVMGVSRVPLTNNPPQFKKVLAPMDVLNVVANHPSSDRIQQGLTNFQAIGIKVITTSTGGPVKATSFSFNTNGGGIDVNNLTQARLYYTGNSSAFAATNQFGDTYIPGSAIAAGKWLPFSFNSELNLVNDTNYFWLTFDVKAAATLGDSIDAEVTNVVIDNMSQTITNPAPAGTSVLRQEYCFSSNSTGGRCIDTARVGDIANYTGISGCASYTMYPKASLTTTNVYRGSSVPVYLTFTSPSKVSIFIDLNRNGEFENGEEYNLTPLYNVASVNTSILIPQNAMLGETRMRIRSFGGQTQGGTNKACSDWNNSETEDYTITVLPTLPQVTYVWNQTAPADFTVASNWTPARVAATATDRLVFDTSSTPVVVNNVFNSTIKSLEVAKGTKLVLNSVNASLLAITDSLILADSATISSNGNLTVQTGESMFVPGTLLLGNGTGIDAKLKRWVGPSNRTNLDFPFTSVKGSRAVSIKYSVAPNNYGTITASFVPTKALGDFGFPLYDASAVAYINRTCTEGYWDIAATDGLEAGIYEAWFTMDSINYITVNSQLAVVNRVDEFSAWTLNGTGVVVFGPNTSTTLIRNSMFGFGQFAIGGDTTQNSLPVELIKFTAKASNKDAALSWTTASEKNNKGFELERSVDGKSFTTVQFIKGAKNSNLIHNYNYTDRNAFAVNNTLYYRLKQIDMDGNSSYSAVVKVSSYMQNASTVNVYPNPFTQSYSVALDLKNDTEVSLSVTDIQGKEVAQETVLGHAGSNILPFGHIASMDAGLYFLRITIAGETQIIKLIKQ